MQIASAIIGVERVLIQTFMRRTDFTRSRLIKTYVTQLRKTDLTLFVQMKWACGTEITISPDRDQRELILHLSIERLTGPNSLDKPIGDCTGIRISDFQLLQLSK